LNDTLSLEHSLPIVRVPLKATPHSLIFDAENEVLAVMVSTYVKDMVRYLKPAGDDRKQQQREEEMLERGEDPTKIVYNEADGTFFTSRSGIVRLLTLFDQCHLECHRFTIENMKFESFRLKRGNKVIRTSKLIELGFVFLTILLDVDSH